MIRLFTHSTEQGAIEVVTTLEDRIRAQEERLKKLRAKNARAKARARTVHTRTARREDTRRKFLVGAVVLARVEKGLLEPSVLREWMGSALEREEDRALFDLSGE